MNKSVEIAVSARDFFTRLNAMPGGGGARRETMKAALKGYYLSINSGGPLCYHWGEMAELGIDEEAVLGLNAELVAEGFLRKEAPRDGLWGSAEYYIKGAI